MRRNLFATLLTFLITLFLLASCKKIITGIAAPITNLPLLSQTEYSNIVVQLVDYNVVRVTHQAGPDLWSSDICKIEIGTMENGQFRKWATYPSDSDTIAPYYLIHFDFTVAMDSSKITQPLALRYRMKDSTFVEVERTVPLYKYPYFSEKVLVEAAQFGLRHIWDIAINEKKLFFHPMNMGLYEYDLETKQSAKIYEYWGGHPIAATSNYVFCDIHWEYIERFNLTTHTPDLKISFGDIYSIEGLAVDEQSLYVLLWGKYNTYIKQFSFDGALLDSIPFPSYDYFMAIHDSILYFKDAYYCWDPRGEQLSRFDLRTKRFLTNLMSPAKRISGFKIWQDYFYFFDVHKKFVGVVPVGDLIPVQSAEKKAKNLEYKIGSACSG